MNGNPHGPVNRIFNNPAGIYMFKVNKRNTRTRWEIYSKLTTKTPERRYNGQTQSNNSSAFTSCEKCEIGETRCEICSKLTIKAPERCHTIIVKHTKTIRRQKPTNYLSVIDHYGVVLVSLLLSLNIFLTLF